MAEATHGTLLRSELRPTRSFDGVSTWDLGCGLLERLGKPEAHDTYVQNQQQLRLFTSLRTEIEKRTEVPENRLSPRSLAQSFQFMHHYSTQYGLPIRGANYLDVGCGSLNPFARMFGHLMVGAARAACLELDPIQDPSEAARSIARMAATAAIDPTLVFGTLPITGRDCLTNVADFDLARLAKGDASGLNSERLTYLQRSASDTGLPDRAIDVVVSNSVLEHVADPEATIAELTRITKPGGFAVHGIDVSDHRWYAVPGLHKLEFLTVQTDAKIVHECNRLRLVDFERLFAKYGLRTLARWPGPLIDIPPELRQRFAEPWRSMPEQHLREFWCQYLLRRD